MKSILYSEMALTRDLPEHGLRRGDVVRPVARHLGPDGSIGFSVEVLGATGHTLAVITVPGAALERLRKDEVLSVRTFAGTTVA
jgi:hypothetical protein